MTIHLPEDLESPVRAEVLSGQFASEDDLVAAAVRAYLRREGAHAAPERTAAGQEPAVSDIPIWEVVDGLRKSVSPKEFLKLPRDGAEQLDHYLYGSPKRSTE